jgi:hypothetical protein
VPSTEFFTEEGSASARGDDGVAIRDSVRVEGRLVLHMLGLADSDGPRAVSDMCC